MTGPRTCLPLILLLSGLAAPPALWVRIGSGWREWWRADSAPARWDGPLHALADAVRWQPAGIAGVEWGELTLSGNGEAWRIRVVLVRLDPSRLRFETREAVAPDGTPAKWTIDSAGQDAAVALNAGQFTSQGPWGWLVRRGRERRAPGRGPLAPAFVVDTAGGVSLVPADSVARLRGSRAVREAFQSYPALLVDDGALPVALQHADRGVDLDHRDARLALGLLRDGRVLIALTRFEGLGGVLANLPFGLTTPEIAAVMGALGCSRAMLLDGGISSQLWLRGEGGRALAWPGFRRVPLGLVAVPR